MKKILVIGGEGFIGWHIVNFLRAELHTEVHILSRSPKENPFEGVPFHVKNLWEMPNQEVITFLSQFSQLVFTGGADERNPIQDKARDFFYEANVTTCVKLVQWAEAANLEKVVISGSYFTAFHRQHPEWKMEEYHPYAASRIEQQRACIAASTGKTAVIVLELPYIFGAVKHKIPLWKPLVNYVKFSPVIFYTDGGTLMVSVETVAKAAIGALHHAKHGDCLLIGDKNWTWKQLLSEMATALGKKRSIITVPTFLVKGFSYLILLYFKVFGKEYGLHPVEYMNAQTNFTYFDTQATAEYLHYQATDLKQAIRETVERCEAS
ncbi:MAG: NAD-dependent epimerase/dehydratase family protein [Bacteroidia bacterium]